MVRDDYAQLVKDKDRAAEAMQSNVFQNFPKFITASKEIGSKSFIPIITYTLDLESDMLELRHLLTEVNSVIKGISFIHNILNERSSTTRPQLRSNTLPSPNSHSKTFTIRNQKRSTNTH